MRRLKCAILACAALCAAWPANVVRAHGVAGDRFFPPTVTTDDPFTADELALPTLSYVKNAPGGDGPANHQLDAGFEFDKLIFPRFSIGISNTFISRKPDGGRGTAGWDNLEINAKYEVLLDDPHEAIVSVGLVSEIGGTGTKHVGAANDSTFTPTLYFGKGFGDLPDAVGYLKPFALTCTIGQTFPTGGAGANALELGLAVEYSLPYLRQHVRDLGMPAPLRDMIPVVEFTFETPENRAGAGLTTGFVNPGVLWETPYFQVGVEANIPLNGRSGAHVGATVQAWFFLDDIYPKAFGRPVFEGP